MLFRWFTFFLYLLKGSDRSFTIALYRVRNPYQAVLRQMAFGFEFHHVITVNVFEKQKQITWCKITQCFTNIEQTLRLDATRNIQHYEPNLTVISSYFYLFPCNHTLNTMLLINSIFISYAPRFIFLILLLGAAFNSPIVWWRDYYTC